MEVVSVSGGLWGHWQEPGVGQGLINTLPSFPTHGVNEGSQRETRGTS